MSLEKIPEEELKAMIKIRDLLNTLIEAKQMDTDKGQTYILCVSQERTDINCLSCGYMSRGAVQIGLLSALEHIGATIIREGGELNKIGNA